MSSKIIQLSIYRFEAELNINYYYQNYILQYNHNSTILDLLLDIFNNQDQTLSFDANCRIGLCRSCILKINGKITLSCQANVKELHRKYGNILTLTPIDIDTCLTDLISKKTMKN